MEVTRVWKDPKYRASLSAEELAALPAHPAGESWPTLATDELCQLIGGALSESSQIQRPTINSGGYVCTLTTECPIWSFCC